MDRDLTLTQAAQAMGVSVVTLSRLIHRGKLEAYAVNPASHRPAYRITEAALEAHRKRLPAAADSRSRSAHVRRLTDARLWTDIPPTL